MTSWEEMSSLISQFGSEKNVARRVRQLRESMADEGGRGWSQEELARRMTEAGYPMTHTSIWKIENPEKKSGRRSVPIGEAIGFARVFGVTLAELLLPAEAIVEVEAWQELTAAAAALNEVRHHWALYHQAIERVRTATSASPRLAQRIADYRADVESQVRKRQAAQYIHDADDQRDAEYWEKHPQAIPSAAYEGYAPVPAIQAATDALSTAQLPASILEALALAETEA